MASDFYSQFKESEIFKAVKTKESPLFYWVKIEKKIFSFFSIFSFLSLLFFYSPKFLGLFFLSFSLYLFAFLRDLFFEKKLKNPKPKSPIDLLDFEVAEALFKTIFFSREKKINSSLFLYFLLDEKSPKIKFIFGRLYLSLRMLKEDLLREKKEGDFEEFLKKLLEKKEKIKIGDVLYLLSETNEILKNFLVEHDLKSEDLKEVADWAEYLEEEFLEGKKFWKWENLVKIGTLTREWTAGYTILLDNFSFDLTQKMKKEKFKRIFVHPVEIMTAEKILAGREKNDVLIVGEEGSGRRSIVEALARNFALGLSFPELNFRRVVYLDLPRIIAETETIEEAEKILDQIFQEVIMAGNVILVLDNLHQYIAQETQRTAGVIEISGVLSSYLPHPEFRCIGITNFEGLHKNLEQKPTILNYFEKIEVKEVSEKETLLILKDRVLRLENKYKVFFTYQSLKNAVSLSVEYLPALYLPEKAIEIVDELAVSVSRRRNKIVFPQDVVEIIERKSEIPIGELQEEEKKKLLNLEELLHQRVINQEEGIKEISEALRRAKAKITLKKGPIGSFLFLGPTGVGKTETAKALAEIYFGSAKKMIRLDMSEFQNLSDLPRLLGKPGEEGLLTTPVRENPFSLLLLDEFEKAHPNILNLFLTVFDEGYLTDGSGRKVDFKNTIIIATSNAAYQIILEALKEKAEWVKVKEKILDYVFEKGIFRPELINRFDGVIVFKPLTKENLLAIAELQLQKIKKQLVEKNVEFVITLPLKEKIVELSYDPTFGAREMQRVIQEKVGNPLAKAILAGKIKKGEKITVEPENFEIQKIR